MPKDEIVEEAVTPLEIQVVDDPVEPEEIPPVEEPVVDDEIPVDEVTTPTESTVDYQALYEESRKTNDELQQQVYGIGRPAQQTDDIAPPQPKVPIPDPYNDPEAFDNYLADREDKAAQKALQAVMDSPQMQGLQMTVGMREHEMQKKETKEELGEFFDYERDHDAIAQIQREHPSLPMKEAARIHVSNQILKQNSQLKEGVVERKRAQVPPTGGASRTVQPSVAEPEPEKQTLTKTQADFAQKYFGHHEDVLSGKITALEKYQRGANNMLKGGYLE